MGKVYGKYMTWQFLWFTFLERMIYDFFIKKNYRDFGFEMFFELSKSIVLGRENSCFMVEILTEHKN